MKLLSLIGLLLLGLLPLRANTDLHIFYYSTVEFVETPLSRIRGSVPLSKAVAMERNHYRFAYDEQQRLVAVSFFNGNTARQPNHTASLFTLAHRMEFEYGADFETVRFYNENNQEVPVLGNCYRFVYLLDDHGFRTELHFLDQNSQRITNSWGIYQYDWEYQADGSVIEDRFDAVEQQVAIRPGFEFYRLRLRFNLMGHIALMQNIDESGALVENSTGAAQDRINTNASGHFLEWNVLNSKGELERGNGPDVAIGKQAFNAYGYEVALVHQDEQSQLMTSSYGICQSKTSFDKFGNIQQRFFYDEDGSPTLHQSAGYHSFLMEWSTDGNQRTAIRYFDLAAKPCLHRSRGYHQAKYEYDTQGRLAKVSYHTTDGSLVERKDNQRAYSVFTYDEATGQPSAKHYSKTDQLLKS